MARPQTQKDQLLQLLQQAVAQQGIAQVQPSQPTNFGLPAQPATAPPATGTPASLQPTGVSVPVTVPLPDGRELSLRVHFGPEAAGNLQQLAALALQLFGPYLAARYPYRGGNYAGGNYGGYGSYPRRTWR